MTTVVIIQARTNSSRLPAKVMKVVGGKTILQRVIERAQKMKGADEVVVAVPKGDEQTLGRIAVDSGAAVYVERDVNERDVLSRYFGAARVFEADIVVRITADCPLIDPEICDRVIQLRNYKNAHYASNCNPRSFPKGLDCEVFTIEALMNAYQSATSDFDREHVTPWIKEQYERTNLASGFFDLAAKRWTLDYPDDLKFFEAVFAVGDPQSMKETLAILKRHPEFELINAEFAREQP